MFGENYQTIYLHFTSHPITVPLEVYEQVTALVQARRICQFCQSAYTKQNPMVAENCCLQCFIPRHESSPKNITFVGEHPSTQGQERGYNVYLFLDRQGYLSFCRNNSDYRQNLERSIVE